MSGPYVSHNVLLTGATGFVGRQIHRALLARGHRVTPVVRAGTASRLDAQTRSDAIATPELFGENRDWWRRACLGFDAVIHAAWFVEPSSYLASPANVECLAGSLTMALGALDAGVSQFIGVGTCFEYRLPAGEITIASPLGPTSLYATSKLALFQSLSALFAPTGIAFSWARLFYLHGEGENEKRLVPYLRARLAANETAKLSIGTQVRDFLDVAVAGDMIASLVATRQAGPVNICSGEPITIRAFAERIADETGQRGLLEFGTEPLRPTDPPVVTGICNLLPVAPT